MDSRETKRDERVRELDEQADRYREAAVRALGQLEWIVGYLRSLNKPELAKALERNRRRILERIS